MSPESESRGWIVGWDIGGAHLKVALADVGGRVHRVETHYTPLWRGLEHLDAALGQVLAGLPDALHRVTMTAELVDLFDDRAQGVAALTARLTASLPSGRLGIYAGPDGLVSPERAAEHADRIASANWHATAGLVAGRLSHALLVDVGSTTTDIIPIAGAGVRARGYTDRERLATQELLYTGVVRTSVMSLTHRVPLAGDWIELAAEHFATMADVYRLTGELPPYADLGDTADGRDKTERASAVRLARMVGDDAGRYEPGVWRELARYLRECQLTRLGQALARQCSLGLTEDAPLVGAGVGRFLVQRAAQRQERPYMDLSELIDPGRPEAWTTAVRYPCAAVAAADCAPATAMALLAAGPNHATID